MKRVLFLLAALQTMQPITAHAIFIDRGDWGLDLPPPIVDLGDDPDPERSYFFLSDDIVIDYNSTDELLLIQTRNSSFGINSRGEQYPLDDILTALISIDNDGNFDSGFMAWTGRVPELGIEDESLLFFGIFLVGYTLRGVDDYPDPCESCGDNFTGLLEVEYSIYDFGPLAGYSTFFSSLGSDLAAIPEGRCYPLMTAECLFDEDFHTEGAASFHDFFGVRRAVPVPEPGTLALLGIGLFGMGLARRKKV